jgi:hypothetical protein
MAATRIGEKENEMVNGKRMRKQMMKHKLVPRLIRKIQSHEAEINQFRIRKDTDLLYEPHLSNSEES